MAAAPPVTAPTPADDATKALLDTFVPNVCHVCKSPGRPELHKCSRCRSVWYCSRGCQAIDWKRGQGTGHKELCKPFRELRTRIESATAAERKAQAAASGPAPPGLFQPSDPVTLARYKRASTYVLEEVLGRPYYDDDVVPVLYQRHCAHCWGVAAHKAAEGWVSCAGCSTACWCSDACRTAGAASHSRSCAHNEIVRGAAAAVAASLRAAGRPPLWSPSQLLLPPAPLPNPPSDWASFFQQQERELLVLEPGASSSSGGGGGGGGGRRSGQLALSFPSGVTPPADDIQRALLSEDLSDPMTCCHALRVRKTPFYAPSYTKTDQFANTGSGQT